MSCEYTVRPETRVPIGGAADVVVAGAGSAGLLAALAAARRGARTVLVDRLMAPGGNMGPGMICGATFGMGGGEAFHRAHFHGLAAEYYRRLCAAKDDMPDIYAVVSHAASRVGIEMCREAGVRLVLSAYAADPIMDGRRVAGLFVETKSGTVAFPARVVIDATGDADVALRAGATIRRVVSAEDLVTPAPGEQLRDGDNLRNPAYRNWNDGQLYFYLGEARIADYSAFCKRTVELTAAQRDWARTHLRIIWKGWPDAMVPILKEGWESGEFQVEKTLRPNVIVALNNWFAETGSRPEIMGGRAGIFGDYDTGNWEDVAMMEAEVRNIVFDGVRYFRRRRVPGFETAFVLCMSPFLGARGGPFIEGEATLTPRDAYNGIRFDDTILSEVYRPSESPEQHRFDFPYRMFLPRGLDGLLVTGRGASFTRRGHDSFLRARTNLIRLGEIAGIAAAVAVRSGTTPKTVDVKTVQREVRDAGYSLGDAARLRELGLAP